MTATSVISHSITIVKSGTATMLKRSLAQFGFEYINCIMALWVAGHTPQESSQTQPIRASNGRFDGGEYN